MTLYQCDTCDREFPGGAKGSTFLVLPEGRTYHFCSGACIRAHVNGAPTPVHRWRGPLLFLAGGLFEILLQNIVNHFMKGT